MRSYVFFAVTALVAAPAVAHAQMALGARIGTAGGSAGYYVLEGHARVNTINRLYLIANVEWIGGIWACSEEISCGYDGTSYVVGAAIAPLDSRKTLVSISAGVGAFIRTSSYGGSQYAGDRRVAARIGLEAEGRIIGPLRVQAALAHRRIFDAAYKNAEGHDPNYTGFSVGLVLVSWR